MKCLINFIHRLYVVKSHQIKAESAKLVFRKPETQRINHIPAEHLALACSVFSCAGISFHAEEIARNADSKRLMKSVVHVIEHNVHYNAYSAVCKRLYHLLEFFYAHFAVERIGRIRTFRNSVIFRIVAPVECAEHRTFSVLFVMHIRFVHRAEVKHRKELYVRYTKLFDMVKTGRNAVK